MENFDNLDVGELMARYARMYKRILKLQEQLDIIRVYLKEKV